MFGGCPHLAGYSYYSTFLRALAGHLPALACSSLVARAPPSPARHQSRAALMICFPVSPQLSNHWSITGLPADHHRSLSFSLIDCRLTHDDERVAGVRPPLDSKQTASSRQSGGPASSRPRGHGLGVLVVSSKGTGHAARGKQRQQQQPVGRERPSEASNTSSSKQGQQQPCGCGS